MKIYQNYIMLILVVGTILLLGVTTPPLQYIGGILFILCFAVPSIFKRINNANSKSKNL